ncbi:hypothetical protein [Agrobacterium deltaense]|uniref:hypothetical protein n=1 Tax=Agrobacterium deltaense TaxID=1183412 RepID=UPI000F637E7D|nr:hypothetical protein [Agrobacterium deltaense]RRN72041.1 hypothetical protein EIQ31_10995 [Agrobacterium deltaense]
MDFLADDTHVDFAGGVDRELVEGADQRAVQKNIARSGSLRAQAATVAYAVTGKDRDIANQRLDL